MKANLIQTQFKFKNDCYLYLRQKVSRLSRILPLCGIAFIFDKCRTKIAIKQYVYSALPLLEGAVIEQIRLCI